jgi:hypothetical protein
VFLLFPVIRATVRAQALENVIAHPRRVGATITHQRFFGLPSWKTAPKAIDVQGGGHAAFFLTTFDLSSQHRNAAMATSLILTRWFAAKILRSACKSSGM